MVSREGQSLMTLNKSIFLLGPQFPYPQSEGDQPGQEFSRRICEGLEVVYKFCVCTCILGECAWSFNWFLEGVYYPNCPP